MYRDTPKTKKYRETNTLRYAKQKITRKRQTNTLANSSRFRLWERQGKVTLSEIKGFLAVILNMGLVRKPSIKDYWQKRFGSTNTPWCRKMFSRNRFQLIYRFFHLVNNRVTPQRNSDFYDPVAWFKPIMQHANNVFKRYISPNRELSVDEALVGTKA
jgi:hypothetical protein